MTERYKKKIQSLLQHIEHEDSLRKIYTLTDYYADQEALESVEEVAE